ncbi:MULTISPECIES: hypothetical protein [Mycobacteriaceae]|uniref:hypothetical protein n=1 Tax=Mycobacteriaceae TaxID=1762 RepID=UPI000B4A89B1|nr:MULTISPECIES: hypothetical protein [Mycobacteriales]
MNEQNTPVSPSTRGGRLRRAAAITSGTIALAIITAAPAAAQDAPKSKNPFEGVTPTLEFLGPAFQNVWVRVLGTIWALAMGGVGVKLIFALYKMRAAKNGGYASEMTDNAAEVKTAATAFGGLTLLTVIIGAIMFVTQG